MNYSRALDDVFSEYQGPSFSVRVASGAERVYGSGSSKRFSLIFSDEKIIKNILARGALGFGEAYMDGRLTIEGDIEAYLRLRHTVKHTKPTLRLMAATFLAKATTRAQREDQIAQHYDLGNEFFELFLDRETMSYSAGRYESGSETLAEAQVKKLELISHWLALPEGASVLDLGSGWGSFAAHSGEYDRTRVMGYTLSKKQLDYSKKRIAEKHLEKTVSFEYRDMTKAISGLYDGAVLLESIEHVGKGKLESFFQNLSQSLVAGAPLYIQATGRYTPKAVDAWTLKYVFPGGYLPTKEELGYAATKAGFSIEEFHDDTDDYIRTMSAWIHNLEKHRKEIESAFDPRFYRLWELWMHGAKVSFEMGAMNLFRMVFKKT